MRKLGAVVLRLLAASDQRRLQYEHIYHAGNYADVVKHSVLIELLSHMKQKKTPFCYVETHSGAGAYSLTSMKSQTLAEHQEGVNLIFNDTPEANEAPLHPSTSKLLEFMDSLSYEGDPIYPGSPLLASSLIRSQDSLMLCEKDLETFGLLQNYVGDDGRATLLNDNGYKALKRFENLRSQQRALVFIDPPYQMGSDTEQIAALVKFLQSHWRSARVAIWYPVSKSNRERTDRLYSQVRKAAKPSSDCLAAELYDKSKSHAVGTGMLMVNPPYSIDRDLKELLPSLARALGNEESAEIKIKQL